MNSISISTYSPIIVILLSLIGSWFVSRYNAHKEIRKYKYQIYADKLQAKRLEIYPSFWAQVSSLLKRKNGIITREFLKSISDKIASLDSDHAIYFSGNTTFLCYKLRMLLLKILQDHDSFKNDENINIDDVLNNLFEASERFEIGMKGDLGIFMIEFSPNKVVNSYSEVEFEKKISRFTFRNIVYRTARRIKKFFFPPKR